PRRNSMLFRYTSLFRSLNGMQHEQNIAGRDEVFGNRTGVAPSLALGLGTDTRLTLSLLHMRQDNMTDYGIPWVPQTNTVLVANRSEEHTSELQSREKLV